MTWQAFLLVGAGGALGSMLRFALSHSNAGAAEGHFPWGTLTANVIGCLLLGWLAWRGGIPRVQWLLLATGFCGGLTTFSTLSLELVQLSPTGWLRAALYGGATLASGIGAIALGGWLSRAFA